MTVPAKTELDRRLKVLANAAKSGDLVAGDTFWAEIAEETVPFVEDLGNARARVTFLWRGTEQAESVALFCWGLERLDRIPGTDVWHLTTEVPADLRASYGFTENASGEFNWPDYFRAQADPLNPRVCCISPAEMGLPEMHRSILELPSSPPQPWVEEREGVARGSIDYHRLRSQTLDSDRDVWVYRPSQNPLGCILLLDGRFYMDAAPMPTIFDNMLADDALPPLLAVMVGTTSLKARNEESNCSDAFTDFLADELMPWVRHRYTVPAEPERLIVGGKSAAGLASVYAVYRRPDVIGCALAQSATLHWKREGKTLIDRVGSSDRFHGRIWLEAGSYEYWGPEQSFVALGLGLSEAITAKGGTAQFRQFTGGHDPLVWRGTISDALQFLCKDWRS